MTLLAWVGGAVTRGEIPSLKINDHGVVAGDGVFETAKVLDRVPFALTRHLRRLEHSAAGLGLVVDAAQVREGIAAVLADVAAPDGLARLRITVTGGPSPLSSERGDGPATVIVGLAPAAPAAPFADVVITPWVRNERAATAGLKTTSYAENVVALRYAHERGGTEAIFANTVGMLCEGTGSNVFLGLDGRLVTPALSTGCLRGVTRDLLLEWLGDVAEVEVPLDALRSADEAFLASTLRDVQPVRWVDGAALAATPGELTRRAAAVFAERAVIDIDP